MPFSKGRYIYPILNGVKKNKRTAERNGQVIELVIVILITILVALAVEYLFH